jgi:thiamine biosynthesis protein ThiI
MHAAEKIALKANIQALVTSESIEQNSSEVLASFNAVKGTTTPLVLRPLIACDKKKVTTIAREIGIEYYTKTVSEYPLNKFKNTNPILKNEEEINFNGDVLARVINEAKVYDIRDIGRATEAEIKVVDMVEQIPEGTIIIDIRSPEESENNPLTLDGVKIKPLPFYKLASQFINFDHSKEYLLYCDHGVMSKIQALLLIESGFKNVKVYRPRDKKVII